MADRIWAVVIDPMRARVVRGFEGGDGQAPVELVSQAQAAHLRALLSDVFLGGAHDGRATGAPAALLDAGALAADQTAFIDEVFAFLAAQHRAGHFARLAVFADPAMLRIIDGRLPPGLRDGLSLHAARHLMAVPHDALLRRLRRKIDQSEKQSGGGPRNQGSD